MNFTTLCLHTQPIADTVADFDMGDVGSCPGGHRGGDGIMALTKKMLLAPLLPQHHANAFWELCWFSVFHCPFVMSKGALYLRGVPAAC